MNMSIQMIDSELTPQARDIYQFILRQDEWVTRREIAEHLGKKHLNRWTIEKLDELVTLDMIEVERIEKNPLPLFRYRVKEKVS